MVVRVSIEDGEERYTDAFEANSADLLAFCERRLGADGADALADAMVAAWRNVSSMPRDPSQARMWLFTVTRGAVQNAARGRRRRMALADRLRRLRHEAFTELAYQVDLHAEVRASLSDDDAELLRLVYWEGFTITEAAQIVGMKPATARTRHARAKDRLRVSLRAVDDAQPTT